MAATAGGTLTASDYSAVPILRYSNTTSHDIPQHFVQTYADYVIHDAQQKASKFRRLFPEEMMRGEYHWLELTGSDELDELSGRYQDTSYTEHDEDRRRMHARVFSKAFLFEQFDPRMLYIDPQSAVVQKVSWAAGRVWDDVIVDAMWGDVTSGHDQGNTSTVSWSSANSDCTILGNEGGDGGLSIDHLEEASIALDEAEYMDEDEPRFIICKPRDVANLLHDNKVTSADYNTVKALVNGDINTFYGFTFIKSNRIETGGGGSYNRCWAGIRGALRVAPVVELMIRINEESTKNYCTSLYAKMALAAVRVKEDAQVEIQTSASATVGV